LVACFVSGFWFLVSCLCCESIVMLLLNKPPTNHTQIAHITAYLA
jgi:hypothetical protein